MRSLLWPLVLPFGLLVPAAESPRLAISPVIPPGADDGPDLGRIFADLLAVQLSSSDSWSLVERAQLASIEDEWLLKGSGLAERAVSLRIGALSRADLVLECRVSYPAVEKPWCRISVVETARAEVLAEREVALRARPTGPWYRSPPEADAEALSATARELLGAACARLAEWRGQGTAFYAWIGGQTGLREKRRGAPGRARFDGPGLPRDFLEARPRSTAPETNAGVGRNRRPVGSRGLDASEPGALTRPFRI